MRIRRHVLWGILGAILIGSFALFTETPHVIERMWSVVIPGAHADVAAEQINLRAIVGTRELYIMRGPTDTVHIYDVAVGTARYPTPRGRFFIRKIVWNPAWNPPPDAPWARGQRARGPRDPSNPMKVAKIFFKEPDYYIHGTGDVNSLGWDASHGCLRMHPDDVARVAQVVMNAGGVAHDWDWVKRTMHIGETRVINLKQPVQLIISDSLPDFMVVKKSKADSTSAGTTASTND